MARERSRLRRALDALAWAAVLVVGAPAVLYAFPALAGADGAFLVLSGSMSPMLEPGDLLFVRATDAPLAPGDVATFRPHAGSATLVTHRVVEVASTDAGPAYRTRGDANDADDPWRVPHGRVVGEYAFHIPGWGLLLQALRTKVGYVLLVLVPGGLLIGREFVRLYRELDAADRAKKQAAVDRLLARLEAEEAAERARGASA